MKQEILSTAATPGKALVKAVVKKEVDTHVPSPSQPKFSCCGCGAPGVIKANCTTCSGRCRSQVAPNDLGFCAVDIQADMKQRPVVFINILGIEGCANLDTSAKLSVASYGLFCKLRDLGLKFGEETANVTLADGIRKSQKVYTIKVLRLSSYYLNRETIEHYLESVSYRMQA
ncbi:unnamed protein product [Arctia plantaginis]|uniref:Uncharacterized protein n=1 Tax=Arctia plantaginis TaxID=874455 RepID=A0A8S1B0J3_ARCPL|nr:unnamed protein product [Arctia plantaginis]